MTVAAVPQTALRPPEQVMRLDRMGSSFPTRLSFMRALLRNLATVGARVERTRHELDDHGFGTTVTTVHVGRHAYSLCAFSTPLDPSQRTDRVIAEAWDASFVLYDGVPTDAELDRLRDAAPRQEAARYEPTDLVLSRANRSVRLFDHAVDQLATGRQPDRELVGSIGYLMRTTAVYGNGKFGIADRDRVLDRPVVGGAFRLEMLTVWLIRSFTHDLVEHIAQRRSPTTSVGLEPQLRRHLGVGNATGLGMAPFLVSHPELLNNWVLARETALARVCAVERATAATSNRFARLLERAQRHVEQWNVDDREQQVRIERLRDELSALDGDEHLAGPYPWQALVDAAERRSLECAELVAALVIEVHPELVDGLADCTSAAEAPRLDPAMTLAELAEAIERDWSWATAIDFASTDATRRFWYTSEDKLEPRLGDRYAEPGAERERPLDIARRVASLATDLGDATVVPDSTERVAHLLARHPHHRLAVERVQGLARQPYAEIRDNLIDADVRPIDMLRFKLAFFGASKFDPKSDLWTRVTLFQGAPTVDELDGGTPADLDNWWMPVL